MLCALTSFEERPWYRRAMYLLAVGVVACAAPVAAAADAQQNADERFAAQEWTAAATAYRALLGNDAGNATNRFRLARSLHELGELDAARDAYAKALETGYLREPQARYHLARLLAGEGQRESALVELERLAELGAPSGRVIAATGEFSSLQDDPEYGSRYARVIETLTPCTAPEFRYFDFWLGEWDVTAAGSAGVIASSRILSAQDGCAVTEHYTAGNFTGTSLNFYDATTGQWHQSWMSNGGGAVHLAGSLDAAGAMQMTDAGLAVSKISGTVNKVTWTPRDDGSVRQLWEQSSDQGKSWTVVFDGIYTRR